MVNYEYLCPYCQKTCIRTVRTGRVVCEYCLREFITGDFEVTYTFTTPTLTVFHPVNPPAETSTGGGNWVWIQRSF